MEYFAGANTHCGFCNLFEAVFEKTERMYIIKGSSGCGKSTLIKKLCAHGEKMGFKAERIRCSADPDSLDGAIFPQLSVGLADGTSPHVMEPKYVGARDVLVDLGCFLDNKRLFAHREQILELWGKKKQCFSRAYSILSAKGRYESAVKSDCIGQLDLDGIKRSAKRLLSRFSLPKGEIKKVFASAFTRDGTKTLPAFEGAKKVIFADKRHYFSSQFISACADIARERGLECVEALSPFDASVTEALYFPCGELLISAEGVRPFSEAGEERRILCTRFCKEGMGELRLRERINSKLIPLLLSEASLQLRQAFCFHQELEKIYTSAADFDGAEAVFEKLKKEIFES